MGCGGGAAAATFVVIVVIVNDQLRVGLFVGFVAVQFLFKI